MIGAKKESRANFGPAGHGLEEFRFEQAVFVMASLGPRIGKQNPNFLESYPGRKHVQKFPRLGAEEMTVGQPGTIALAVAPHQAIGDNIDADAEFIGIFLRIVDEKVSVPAANFPDDGSRHGKQCRQFRPQMRPAFANRRKKFRFEIHAIFSAVQAGRGKP